MGSPGLQPRSRGHSLSQLLVAHTGVLACHVLSPLCLASQACDPMPRVEEPPDVQLHRPGAYSTRWVLPPPTGGALALLLCLHFFVLFLRGQGWAWFGTVLGSRGRLSWAQQRFFFRI